MTSTEAIHVERESVMNQTVLKHISPAELEMLETRTGLRFEVWNGQPVAMTGGTAAHNLITLGLYRVVHAQLKPPCRVFVADAKLHLSAADDSDIAYPDLMVVCEPQPSNTYQTRPVLLAEVLSDSSVRRDRVQKLAAYSALESLQAYLILSQQDVEIDVYQRVTNWQRERFQDLEAEIVLQPFDLQLALQAIYADVRADLGY